MAFPWIRADAVLTGDILADMGSADGGVGTVEVVGVASVGGGRVRLEFDSGEFEVLPGDATVALVNGYRRGLAMGRMADAILDGC